MNRVIVVLFLLSCCTGFCFGDRLPARYEPLPLGSVQPEGWLKNQLLLMRNGSTGHLDEVYSKLQQDNGWLGGRGDFWEETPYWLDGAVPLAYLLNDRNLQDKVLKYINWTLDHQRSSGYFGPISKAERERGMEVTADDCNAGDDWWPRMVMLKVLRQYYEATRDERVIPFMSRYFRYQLNNLQQCPLRKWSEWSESRGADNVLMALWLHNKTAEPYLLELSSLLLSQSYTWTKWFGSRDWVIRAAAYQDDHRWMTRHAVNVAMGLKDPLVRYQLTGEKAYLDTLKTGFRDLMTLHGLPMGIFSGDEDLHGNAPSQGVELCAITEAMFSLEQIVAGSGEVAYMDALERMAFNALPTQTTDDYMAKQYYQIANQVQVSKGVFDFSLPWDRGMCNVYGMRSGYTCCLTNMHQGWTKFASHLWYRAADGGLAALHYAPSTVSAPVGAAGRMVTIVQETTYPFEETIRFRITSEGTVRFPLHLRIPGWCQAAVLMVNGNHEGAYEGGQVVQIIRDWKKGDVVTLALPMQVRISAWGQNSRSVERGPLVYALKLEEQWDKGYDEQEGEYFTVAPKTDWNYGLLNRVVKAPHQIQVKQVRPVDDTFVWNLEHAPIELVTVGKKIPNWKLTDGVARQPVTERMGYYKGEVSTVEEQITLVPYGCTKVRVVAFPVVR